MKTLKKYNEIKRVKNSSDKDNELLESMLNDGWKYCQKSEWKKTRVKEEPKTEKKEGKKRSKTVENSSN